MTLSANWNSPENKQRRRDAEWEQISREYDRIKDGFHEIIAKPFWWALALTIWIFVAIKYLDAN